MTDQAPPPLKPLIAPRSPRAALEPESAPPPPPPSRAARHPFIVVGNAIFSLLLIAIMLAFGAIYIGRNAFEGPGPLAETKIVYIPRGSGIRDVAEILQRDGVIENQMIFIGGVLVHGARDDLKWGEYSFPVRVSMQRVLETLVEGKSIQHQVTIPEGLTSEQIVQRLRENPILIGEIRQVPREGTLMPDGYRFTRGTTRDQILQQMAQAQKKVLAEAWAKKDPSVPVRSPEEMVILASIVEKETGKADERARVASVFVNRINRKMRLQSDPTIIYGIVGGKGVLGRAILKSDIDRITPYNTYQIDGLPPTPIANPGKASLEAVAQPARTNDLYFVADGTGGHTFADTYDAHLKNVARWRQIEKERQQPPGDTPAPVPGATPPAAPGATPPAVPGATPPAPGPATPQTLTTPPRAAAPAPVTTR